MTAEYSTAAPRPTPAKMPKRRAGTGAQVVPASAQAKIFGPPAKPMATNTNSLPPAPSRPVLPPPITEADEQFCRWVIADLRRLSTEEKSSRKKDFLGRLDLPANIRVLLEHPDEIVWQQGLVLAEVNLNRPYYEARWILKLRREAEIEALKVGIELAREKELAGTTVPDEVAQGAEERRRVFVQHVKWTNDDEALKARLKENDLNWVLKCIFRDPGAVTLFQSVQRLELALQTATAEYERIRTDRTYFPESGNRRVG